MKDKKRTKVATMTFHMAHNYGAMLQAYALERAVNKMGVSCEVLDYRFPYIDQWSGLRSASDLYQECGIMGLAKYVVRTIRGDYRNISCSRRKFDRFMRKDMHLSQKVYFHPEQIASAKYDVVLFGSDQIWNPDLLDGPALEYMGKYMDTDHTRLIAYGASCGTDRFREEWREAFLPLLQRFHALGIREKGLAEYIKSSYGLPTQTVLDPVFLLNRKDWDSVADGAEISIHEPYVLIYAFDTGDTIYNIARKIAEEKGLKTVSIVYKPDERCSDMLQLADCGPKDFVNLVRNAQYVCTTSFHGMAFSILFEKDFYCTGHPKYSQRNRDLLDMLGMKDRMIDEGTEIERVTGCDYAVSGKMLQQLRDQSMRFLNEAILGR